MSVTAKEIFDQYGKELGEELVDILKSQGTELKNKGADIVQELKDWALDVAKLKYALANAETEAQVQIAKTDLRYTRMAINNLLAVPLIAAETALRQTLERAFDEAVRVGKAVGLTLIRSYIPIPGITEGG